MCWPRAQLVLGLLAFVLVRQVFGNETVVVTSSEPTRPTVAVVNCVPFHLEILLGTINTFERLQYEVIVFAYRSPHNQHSQRVRDAIDYMHNVHGKFATHDCSVLQQPQAQTLGKAESIMFVSGVEDYKFYREMMQGAILAMQPAHLLHVIHHTRESDLLKGVVTMHPSTSALALAQKNHAILSGTLAAMQVAVPSGWVLPIQPMGRGELCVPADSPCHAHFTIQGNLARQRRNFHQVMKELLGNQEVLRQQGFKLKLVGGTKQDPYFPTALNDVVEVHRNLGFAQFYDEVARSIALVPALASNTYLNGSKITSTMVTSLILGVPVLASREFQQAYSFVPPGCFYLHKDQETYAKAFRRVLQMTTAQHQAVRSCLVAAREEIEKHNMQVVSEQLGSIVGGGRPQHDAGRQAPAGSPWSTMGGSGPQQDAGQQAPGARPWSTMRGSGPQQDAGQQAPSGRPWLADGMAVNEQDAPPMSPGQQAPGGRPPLGDGVDVNVKGQGGPGARQQPDSPMSPGQQAPSGRPPLGDGMAVKEQDAPTAERHPEGPGAEGPRWQAMSR